MCLFNFSNTQLYLPFLFQQRGISILSRGVKYTLYLIEGEFNQSKHIYVICFTTFLRDVLSSSKRGRMWIYALVSIKFKKTVEDPSEVLMMIIMIKVGGNNFQP